MKFQQGKFLSSLGLIILPQLHNVIIPEDVGYDIGGHFCIKVYLAG